MKVSKMKIFLACTYLAAIVVLFVGWFGHMISFATNASSMAMNEVIFNAIGVVVPFVGSLMWWF